ncbi:flavoprotein [Candidatus Epulonipiscium fishelsonii]|uniref:Flavoprotein n=1 Tax=Candidatus Epulonipiscium fishelsonii TaxID=77094 RepID=A0ACC8XAP2_9FIRM|nr:flavoprotein [Epulopiscium sp. SCG-B11WGA-EpuloA1]ONI40152.1 flavoprotein [Epulopiscium sp. SCG-B05WGA-EpuloA1]
MKNTFFEVGVQDYKLRIFDIVMEAEFGTSYNSYLLKGSEKTVLFDSVKYSFTDEFIKNIKKYVDPSKIDYIVVHHTEPDHSGSLYKVLEYAPNATIVGSAIAIKYLKSIINKPFKSQIVKDGDSISVGDKTIKFLSVPMLHWPDTIYSYIVESKILLTCDSFGSHYASDKSFYSELDKTWAEKYALAAKYYFDVIIGPFKPFVIKALDKIANLDIDYICPSHGLIIDKPHIEEFKKLYKEWSTVFKKHDLSIIIPYVSAYGYTKKLAQAVEEEARKLCPKAKITAFDLTFDDMGRAIEDVQECDILIMGSSTLIGDALPQIWQILTSLNPVIHGGKIAACFGSHGWSGEALPNITQRYNQLKFKTPVEPFGVMFKPTDEDVVKIKEWTKSIIESY